MLKLAQEEPVYYTTGPDSSPHYKPVESTLKSVSSMIIKKNPKMASFLRARGKTGPSFSRSLHCITSLPSLHLCVQSFFQRRFKTGLHYLNPLAFVHDDEDDDDDDDPLNISSSPALFRDWSPLAKPFCINSRWSFWSSAAYSDSLDSIAGGRIFGINLEKRLGASCAQSGLSVYKPLTIFAMIEGVI